MGTKIAAYGAPSPGNHYVVVDQSGSQPPISSGNEAGFAFIMAHLKDAGSWLDQMGSSPHGVAQSPRQKAREVFDTILQWLPKLTLDHSQQRRVRYGMLTLKERLEAAGERF